MIGYSTIDSRRITVISSRQDIIYESGGPVPGQPFVSKSRLSGQATQVVYFEQPQGRFVLKRRAGVLLGTLSYLGGAQPINLRQGYSYENTVELRH